MTIYHAPLPNDTNTIWYCDRCNAFWYGGGGDSAHQCNAAECTYTYMSANKIESVDRIAAALERIAAALEKMR